MGKNPNPARINHTRTQVLPRTEPNPKVRNVQEPESNGTLLRNEPNRPEPKCRGSYSVLSLNETVGTFHTFHSKRGILLYLG